MLKDYSGGFFGDIKFEDFSRDTLIELLKLYSKLYLAIDGFWYLSVKERSGNEEALACDIWAWERISKYELARLTKLLKIHGTDVVDLMKAFQVIPLFQNLKYNIQIKNKNDAIVTVVYCPILVALEREGEGREASICNLVDPKIFEAYAAFFSPNIEVKCLKSPPRNNDEICCQWEFKQAAVELNLQRVSA